ncbi:lytic transglycosylase domain-containing protein [Paenibacillus sp. S3N08]|uniref:Lytic transglycosylase domain-containing protein n=2 Tax=Paenibacillus agricola TaxID=2716264 RepID=A0ABX0JAZ9_9BACL|nr:lytic transglycosylase domain-containing protein [Paenibacillus agricola]
MFQDGKGASTSSDQDGFNELLNDILAQTGNGGIGQVSTVADLGPALAAKVSLKPASLNPLFAAASSYQSEKTAEKPIATDLDKLIHDASSRNHVQPSLVKAVIDAESSFNSKAVSHAGAKGLMQLMDATGRSVGVDDPFDPAQNVQGGTKYLSNLLKKYDGNQGVALAAYNAGSGRIDRLGIANDQDLAERLGELPKETQKYVTKVLNLQRNYEG